MASAQARVVRKGQPGVRRGSVLAALPLALALAAPVLWTRAADAARLCMLPADLPFEEDDERRESLERIVTRSFEAASIEITPSTEVRALLEDVDRRSGAIFDPATGRVDPALDEIYREDIERSVREAFGCAGFVELRLASVRAFYDGTSARWDGQSARINSGARIATRVFASVLLGTYITEQGWVPALSLWIRVIDLRSRDIAFRSAGIEPLMDFSYSRDEDLLPEDRWLRDDAKIQEAVDSALGPDLSFLKADALPVDESDEKAFRWK